MNGKKCIKTMLLLICTCLLLSGLFGFWLRRGHLVSEVQNYVKEKYHLTPTDIRISFSIDGMDNAFVTTKELPFAFEVYISRESKEVWHDLYVESLVEHWLEEFISGKLVSLVDKNDIRVVLENRFSESNSKLTVEKITVNPNIVLENPDITYFCSVDGIEMGSERSFQIFNQITKYFNPTSIYFNYVDTGNKENSVCIKKIDFSKIQNKEDLLYLTK